MKKKIEFFSEGLHLDIFGKLSIQNFLIISDLWEKIGFFCYKMYEWSPITFYFEENKKSKKSTLTNVTKYSKHGDRLIL